MHCELPHENVGAVHETAATRAGLEGDRPRRPSDGQSWAEEAVVAVAADSQSSQEVAAQRAVGVAGVFAGRMLWDLGVSTESPCGLLGTFRVAVVAVAAEPPSFDAAIAVTFQY